MLNDCVNNFPLKSQEVIKEWWDGRDKVILRTVFKEYKIEKLMIMWRNHFIEKCDLKYLPDWWKEKIDYVRKIAI